MMLFLARLTIQMGLDCQCVCVCVCMRGRQRVEQGGADQINTLHAALQYNKLEGKKWKYICGGQY